MQNEINVTEAVKRFNTIAGKIREDGMPIDEWWTSLKNDMARVVEEVKETFSAIEEKDRLELLDGVCDIEYTLSKLKMEIISTGIDYNSAIEAVCNNNHSKHIEIKDFSEDMERIIKSIELYGGTNEVYAYKAEYEGKEYVTIKRKSDDKVLKPEGFNPVVLEQFLNY